MSTPSSIKLEKWETDVLAAIVEQDYQRLSRETIITSPRAWKRARFANLREACLVDNDVRGQLTDWRDRLCGPIGRVGTYQQRAEILRDLQREWSSTPNAAAYRRIEGDELERLVDRCVRDRFGATSTFGATSDPQRRNPPNRDGLTTPPLQAVFEETARRSMEDE